MQAEQQSELLPCPFCGGPVQLEEANRTRDHIMGERRWWGVVCRNTTNLGGTCCMDQVPSASVNAAVTRWNRRAALSHPSTPQGLPIEPLDFNVFAEVCYNAHIDFSLDKFPSYERAIEHYYITMLNAINAQLGPEQGSKG